MEYNQVRLGKNIRALRKKRRLKLNELADSTGINPPHLGLIERGQRRIRIEMLCRVSDFFNISIDALVFSDLSERTAIVARESDEDILRSQIDELLNGASSERLRLSLSVLRTIFEHEEDAKASSQAEKPDKEIKYK